MAHCTQVHNNKNLETDQMPISGGQLGTLRQDCTMDSCLNKLSVVACAAEDEL